jgi:hypothetical protein
MQTTAEFHHLYDELSLKTSALLAEMQKGKMADHLKLITLRNEVKAIQRAIEEKKKIKSGT